MISRRHLLSVLVVLTALVAALAIWQQARIRRAWWDALASRGPDAEASALLERCEEPSWSGWVSVAASDVAMPCGEPLAASQLSARLDAELRRAWLREQLDGELSSRARWRITRALELSGSPVPVATVTLLLDGRLGDALATEVLLADGGARDARELWMATLVRARRGEPLEELPWRQVVYVAELSGDRATAVQALRAALQVPDDVDRRLHRLPEAWAEALSPALGCDPTAPSCIDRWAEAAAVWEQAPEGEDLPRADGTEEVGTEPDVGLFRPVLDHERAQGATREAVAALLSSQAEALAGPHGRPWDGVGIGGESPTLPRALWSGRMGPWTQALWARELARRSALEGEVRRSETHLVATLGTSPQTLCGRGATQGELRVVLDRELVARALLELHPEAIAAASRVAGWTGPDHAVFGATGEEAPPADPCGSSEGVSEG